MNPRNVLRRIWTTTPQELTRRLRRRLGGASGEDYSLAHILRTRHLDVNLLIDRWERTWRVVETHLGEAAPARPSFDGTTVIELGCGPLFGYGPIALHQGAAQFHYAEPAIQRAVVESTEIRDRYFRRLFDDLQVNYGDCGESFDSWYARVLACSLPLEDVKDDEAFAQWVLSSSVLEHIPRTVLPTILADLRRATTPDARSLHLVDFGAHRAADPGLTQLETLYQQDWDVETSGINYLRKSDTTRLLTEAGFAPTHVVPYRQDPVDRNKIHASWHRYDAEDLESRVVIYLCG